MRQCFYWAALDKALIVEAENDGVKFILKFDIRQEDVVLDRNQAHLLFLFLQEHLKS